MGCTLCKKELNKSVYVAPEKNISDNDFNVFNKEKQRLCLSLKMWIRVMQTLIENKTLLRWQNKFKEAEKGMLDVMVKEFEGKLTEKEILETYEYVLNEKISKN